MATNGDNFDHILDDGDDDDHDELELSDGKILTTMEWLMVFAKVPL